jgi:hypothetical protein
MLCYRRTPQQDDGGLHHAMLPLYFTTRRQGASPCYATMMMPLVVLLWCTVVAYHNDALRRLAMVSGGRMVPHNKTTEGFIML